VVDSAFAPLSTTLLEAIDLLFGFVPGDAAGRLDVAHQDLASSGDDIEVIVGELTPLRPGALNYAPIHTKLHIDFRMTKGATLINCPETVCTAGHRHKQTLSSGIYKTTAAGIYRAIMNIFVPRRLTPAIKPC